MTRHGAAALVLALLPVAPLAAQQPRGTVVEWGAQSTVILGSNESMGMTFGPRAGVRSIGGTRLALSAGAGFRDDRWAGRGEVAVEYVLSPRASKRASVYLGGGLAGVVGGGKGGYLMAYVGLERNPGLGSGWAIEAGLGGGVRLRAAYHWRHFPKGWRPQP